LSKKVLTLHQVDSLNNCYTIERSQNPSMSSTEPKAYLHALEHKWRDLTYEQQSMYLFWGGRSLCECTYALGVELLRFWALQIL